MTRKLTRQDLVEVRSIDDPEQWLIGVVLVDRGVIKVVTELGEREFSLNSPDWRRLTRPLLDAELLKARALAAPPGPYHVVQNATYELDVMQTSRADTHGYPVARVHARHEVGAAIAAYLAIANPTVILELLERSSRLQLLEAIVRDLAASEWWQPIPSGGWECRYCWATARQREMVVHAVSPDCPWRRAVEATKP